MSLNNLMKVRVLRYTFIYRKRHCEKSFHEYARGRIRN